MPSDAAHHPDAALPSAEPSAPRSRLRKWVRRLLPYGFLYGIWLTLCFGCNLADRFVLFPTTHPIKAPDTRSVAIPFRDGSLDVLIGRDVNRDRAWDQIEPEAYVLEFTGNGTRAEEIATYATTKFRPHAVEVWVMNFPGYGKSTGPARLSAIPDAALTTFDAMKAAANGKPVFVAGNSLGTTAALHVAAHRDVAGVILTNPPALKQLIRGQHGWWNLWLLALPVSWQIPSELDSSANAKHCTAPAIILTSSRDTVVPYRYQQLVADAYAGPKQIFTRDAGHNDSFEGSDEQWIREQIHAIWPTRNKHSSMAPTQRAERN